MHRNGPRRILQWRPVVLFGGGFGLAVFEAAQPLFGRRVEWAIVSLAATMMGLELFQRSSEPDGSAPPPGDGKGGPGPAGGQAGPGNPGKPGSPGALAVLVAPVARVSRRAPAAVAVVVG